LVDNLGHTAFHPLPFCGTIGRPIFGIIVEVSFPLGVNLFIRKYKSSDFLRAATGRLVHIKVAGAVLHSGMPYQLPSVLRLVLLFIIG
jgi:hypothetical protein